MGVQRSGIACPTAEPNRLMALALEYPASIKRSGNMVDISELASELAVRIAVMGTAEVISGLNSERGFLSLFFLTKNTMVARVKENIYDIKTATPAK